MKQNAGDVKRKALVKVFNRYATGVGDGGNVRVLESESLRGALGELGFFRVASRSQADVLMKKLIGAMGGIPVRLDSFVLVMNTVTSARPALQQEEDAPDPPPPPLPKPPSPVSSTSPTPTMAEPDILRIHSKSEDRHEWRVSQRRTALLDPPKRTAHYIPAQKEVLPACVVGVTGSQTMTTSPLTAMRFIDVMFLNKRVQNMLQCLSGGWPHGATPAIHGAGHCLGGKVILITDSAVNLLSPEGVVDHSVALADISAMYTTHTGYVGIQAREKKGLAWYAEGEYSHVLKVINEAASRRQGTQIEEGRVDCKQQVDELVNGGVDGVMVIPINVYVPEGGGEEEEEEEEREEKKEVAKREVSPETARDVEWLLDLKKEGKTGFVVDARWQEKRYRISMSAGSLGDVKVGTIKKTLSQWIGLKIEDLRLFSPAGIELTNDAVTGGMMGVQEGEVFTVLKRQPEPSLIIQTSPLLDQTAVVTLTACSTEDEEVQTEPLPLPPTVLFGESSSLPSPSPVRSRQSSTPQQSQQSEPVTLESIPERRKLEQPLQPLPTPPRPPIEPTPRSQWEGSVISSHSLPIVLPSYIANPTPTQVQLQQQGDGLQSHAALQQIIDDHHELQQRLKQHAARPVRPPPPQPQPQPQPQPTTGIFVQELHPHHESKGRMSMQELPSAMPGTPVNQQASVTALHRIGLSKLSPPTPRSRNLSNCLDGLDTSVYKGPPQLAPAVGRPKLTPPAGVTASIRRMTPPTPGPVPMPAPAPGPVSMPAPLSSTAIAHVRRQSSGRETQSEDGYDDPYPMYPTPGAVVLEF